ncbi:MAG: oligopeptide ABC transporter substrate-binding protein OppA, partial [Ketobacter sp.]|nr:oligopeptide ABC transporter substrate-binding protein OppA [Ketobacter sp.]
MKNSLTMLAVFLATIVTSGTFAATVPGGTTLASEQTFTYRVLDEFSSFDPQVVEDTDGADIVRDLFEGLYNQDAGGNNVPG